MNNSEVWQLSQKCFPGGVNSPVRAFKGVGGQPIPFTRAKGALLYDCQSKPYVDYCLSWGAILLGHADPVCAKAIADQAKKGNSFGALTPLELELASILKKHHPHIEKMRFTSSGTEAVMSAVRLARGFTGRDKVIKFEGCYHGHVDSLLVKAGSGLATFGTPDSLGIPRDLAKHTLVVPYNDELALARVFKKHSKDIACVIVEPVAGNMGVVLPQGSFLKAMRQLCTRHKSLLIFDEVMTGYRAHMPSAGQLYSIEPDLTVLGKVIGGGLPVAAFGGSSRIMNHLSPLGGVYQAGTLSGNPLAMASGLSVLKRLNESVYKNTNQKLDHLIGGLKEIFKRKKIAASIARQGLMMTLFFNDRTPCNFQEVLACDKERYARFFHHMLNRGVYLPPSAFEAAFFSAAHSDGNIRHTLLAASDFKG